MSRSASASTCCGSCPARSAGASSRPSPPCAACVDLGADRPRPAAVRARRRSRRPTRTWSRRCPTEVAPDRRPVAAARASSPSRPGSPRAPTRPRPRPPRRRHGAGPRGRRPCVLTLHDLQPLRGRHGHPLGVEARATSAAPCPRAVRARRRVAVPSEFVRRTVLDRLGAPPEQRRGDPARRARSGRPARPRDVLVERYRPRRARGAVPGHHLPPQGPRDAARGLRRRCSPATPTPSWCSRAARGRARRAVADQIAAGPRLRQRVRRLGRISEADVGRAARAGRPWWRCPSRYEGFGLPGRSRRWPPACPVVAADATSLPEVVGDAGRARRRRATSAAWAAAIGDLLADPDGAGPPGARRPGAGGRASRRRPTRTAFADALPTGAWRAA